MSESIPFLEYFRRVEEYRVPGMILYPLDEIIFLVLVCALCGFEDYEEMAMWGEANLEWLREFLPYQQGVATAKTLRKVLSHVDSRAFQHGFERWAANMCAILQGVIAIDGKTLRGSKQEASGEGAVHLVSAFAHAHGLVIGQERV